MAWDSWRERERIAGPYPSGRPATRYRKEDMLFLTVKKYLPEKKRRPRNLVDINQRELISCFKFRKESISPMLKEYESKDLGGVLGPEFKGLKIYSTPKKYVLDDDIGLISHRIDGENMVLCTRCGAWTPMPDSHATAVYCHKCGCMGIITHNPNGGLMLVLPLLTGLTLLAISLWPCSTGVDQPKRG